MNFSTWEPVSEGTFTPPISARPLVEFGNDECFGYTHARPTRAEFLALAVGLPFGAAITAPVDRPELCSPHDGRTLTLLERTLEHERPGKSSVRVAREVAFLLNRPHETAFRLAAPLVDAPTADVCEFLRDVVELAEGRGDDGAGLLRETVYQVDSGLRRLRDLGWPCHAGVARPDLSAFDLARAVHLCRLAMTLGVLSAADGWPLLLACGREVGERFDTWRAFAEGFLCAVTVVQAHLTPDAATLEAELLGNRHLMASLLAHPASPWRKFGTESASRGRRNYGSEFKF